MEMRIGENRRVTMKEVQDVYDKLQDNSFYRDFLNLVRMGIAKIYEDQYYSVMEDAPPPPTITAMVPRTLRSGTSGGGITHRPRAAGGTTYI